MTLNTSYLSNQQASLSLKSRKCKTCGPHCSHLYVLRQEEKYSDDYENIACRWALINKLRCVKHYQSDNTINSIQQFGISEKQTRFEGVMHYETFWVKVSQQAEHTDFDIYEGDYVYFCRQAFKITTLTTTEIMNGCWYIKIVGQRLFPREYRTMLLETGEKDTGNPDDILDFMERNVRV